MDALSDMVRLLNFRAGVYFHSTLCGSWTLKSSDNYLATYHFVTQGNCRLNLPDINKNLNLQAGDLVLLPQNIPHTIEDQSLASSETEPSKTGLICGYFDFEQQLKNPILETLPQFIQIQRQELVKSTIFDDLLRIMFYETEASLPGMELIVDNLSEVLFIYAIRTYIKQDGVPTSYISLLTDEKLQNVIQDIHQNPGKPWSVESIAKAAGMSRSSLAAYFQKKSSISPMQYVTGYRMHFAYKALHKSAQSVAQIAEQTGYNSEVSFRKAFKNYFGVGPGAVRKR